MHNWQTSNPLDAAPDVPSEAEVQAWVVQAAGGDRASQKRIYELIGPRIYRVIFRIVGADEADDVVLEHQETQPAWFGNMPAIEMQCAGQSYKIIESAGKLSSDLEKPGPSTDAHWSAR